MSDYSVLHQIDMASELLGHEDRRAIDETWEIEHVYSLWFQCPSCNRHNNEYFRSKSQYRKPGHVKCKSCGAVLTLKGRNR